MSEKSPDIIVTIDFGMTSTGVAYTRTPHKKIQRISWKAEAGKVAGKFTTKIPTVLRYEAYSSPLGGRLDSLGFQANEALDTTIESKHFRIIEWFKPYLNPNFLRVAKQASLIFLPKSDLEVRRWFIDYLRGLYDLVKWKISEDKAVGPWEAIHIEFRFTWPTTWTAADIEKFRDCIIAAGYQNDQRSHRVDMSLSEAQAAAFYAADHLTEKIKDGENVMVCDVGGGTVDIAVVRAVADTSSSMHFELEWSCQGKAIGATDIDAAFQLFVERRLCLIQDSHLDVARISRDLRESFAWYNIKIWKGPPQSVYSLPTGLVDNEAAGIKEGDLRLTRQDLQEIYHQTFTGVQQAILDALQIYEEPLNYLIGCGGYFHITSACDAFRNTLANAGQYLSNCSETKIEIAPKPELAVSVGGCLRTAGGFHFQNFSLGLIYGDQAYDLASLSKLSWKDGNSGARSGIDARLLEQDTENSSSFNIQFQNTHPEGGYYYIAIVLMPKLRYDNRHDSFNGVDIPICQVRLRKQEIVSKWAFMSGAGPKPLTLTWKRSGLLIYLDLYRAGSKVSIPFEICEFNASHSIKVHVPLLTKRVAMTQWR